MPPPEAQEGSNSQQLKQPGLPPTTVIYVKNEDIPHYQSASANYSDPKSELNVTVGEHLRHCYNKPSSNSISPASKQATRRPHILGRKTSLQNSDLSVHVDDPFNEPPATCPLPTGQTMSPQPSNEFHSRSAPPIDISPKNHKQETKFESEEAIRKSEQVVDVINSVVEKIRRQNVAEQVSPTNGSNKRSNSSNGPIPTKVAKVEEQAKPANRPLASIITTQPLPASTAGHLLPSPRYNQGPIHAQAVMMQQRPIPQIQVPLVTAEQESNDESKIVSRYMCPECLKL